MYKEEKVYTRRTILIGGKERYFISFKDSVGSIVEIEVEENVYKVIREHELIEARISRADRKHIERLDLSTSEIDARAIQEHDTTEKEVLSRALADELVSAIYAIPPLQRRRFLLCRCYDKMQKDIADKEGCSKQTVHRSVMRADNKIKNAYMNFLKEG